MSVGGVGREGGNDSKKQQLNMIEELLHMLSLEEIFIDLFI